MEFTLKNQKNGLDLIKSKLQESQFEIRDVRIELEKLYEHYFNKKDVDNKTRESVTYLLESLCMVLKRDFILQKYGYDEFQRKLRVLKQRRKDKLDESFHEVVNERDWFTDELDNDSRFGYTTTEKQTGLPVLLNDYYGVPLDIFKEEYQVR
jgi:hypothetical protein